MAIRETEVKTYRLTYDCDECGEDMVFNGYSAASSPPIYSHNCANGHKQEFRGVYYPRTVYK